MKISIKLRVFSVELFERRNEGVHWGLMGRGVLGATVGRQHHRGGRGNSGGSTVGVSSTSKNHPSHHKYRSPKQFELKLSKGT